MFQAGSTNVLGNFCPKFTPVHGLEHHPIKQVNLLTSDVFGDMMITKIVGFLFCSQSCGPVGTEFVRKSGDLMGISSI